MLVNFLYRLFTKTGICQFFPDKLYLQFQFRALMGKKLDLQNPQTFNEKLNWLKLFDHNPLYTTLVDKLAVKDWVAAKYGDNSIIIPTLRVYNTIEDIDFNELPDQFVLKTSHSGDSLGVVVCKDKKTFNYKRSLANLKSSLNTDYYKPGREWPYKNVPRKVFAEQYLEDEYGELRDYKFFCFNGKVKALFIATDRSKGHVCFDYFDSNFNHLDFVQSHPMKGVKNFEKPKNFERMIEIAEILSHDIPHVRVDLYDVNGNIYFGEMTFYHYGGIVPFHPESWDYIFGEWLELPKQYINK